MEGWTGVWLFRRGIREDSQGPIWARDKVGENEELVGWQGRV